MKKLLAVLLAFSLLCFSFPATAETSGLVDLYLFLAFMNVFTNDMGAPEITLNTPVMKTELSDGSQGYLIAADNVLIRVADDFSWANCAAPEEDGGTFLRVCAAVFYSLMMKSDKHPFSYSETFYAALMEQFLNAHPGAEEPEAFTMPGEFAFIIRFPEAEEQFYDFVMVVL